MKIQKRIGRNHSARSRYGHNGKPVGITIHHWGSDGQKFDNVVHWLQGAGGRNRSSSAHYVVEAGRVVQIVEDHRAAWHSGTNAGNGQDIGIEMRPEMSAGDWETLVELCAYLERKHGRSFKYRKHSDWKNTACPGRYGSRLGELVDAVNARLAGDAAKPKPKPKPKPEPAGDAPAWPFGSREYFGPEAWGSRSISGYHRGRSAVRQWQQRMADRGWGEMLVDGLYGPRGQTDPAASITGKIAGQFQREKGLPVDNLVGPATWAAAWDAPIT